MKTQPPAKPALARADPEGWEGGQKMSGGSRVGFRDETLESIASLNGN